MEKFDYFELSKEISYALRHAPWEYELEIDEEGWVPIEQLLYSLRENKQWNDIKKSHIIEMINQSEKKRHEIHNEKIRAFYGHSIPMKIKKTEGKPPRLLYHGTTQESKEKIMQGGLLPRSRQYVHLSQDVGTASEVGKRRTQNPVILTINAQKAYENGIKFYLGNEKVWLADFVPYQYIND